MTNNLNLIDIQINDPLRKHGILYVGQYGTSGYAIAAKGYICDFIARGIPISWVPLKFDDSELSDDSQYNILAKSVIKKPLPTTTTVILHCTADLWPKYKNENKELFSQKMVIGYTVWETNQLPPTWVSSINDSVEEVWCPSTYNKQTFENSGVDIPIKIVPHIFLRHVLPCREHVSLKDRTGALINHDPNVFTFYNISELNGRKNVEGLLEAYCKAFTRKDPVRLILKVHYKDYTDNNVAYCMEEINKITRQYPNHANIFLVIKNLTELELLAMHSIGDCYVSLTRSEAFGLTIFDAFNYGKKIIVPGYGGQVDYLGNAHPGLVKYEMIDVQEMKDFSHGFYNQGSQQWANPNIDHTVELMKTMYEKS